MILLYFTILVLSFALYFILFKLKLIVRIGASLVFFVLLYVYTTSKIEEAINNTPDDSHIITTEEINSW